MGDIGVNLDVDFDESEVGEECEFEFGEVDTVGGAPMKIE